MTGHRADIRHLIGAVGGNIDSCWKDVLAKPVFMSENNIGCHKALNWVTKKCNVWWLYTMNCQFYYSACLYSLKCADRCGFSLWRLTQQWSTECLFFWILVSAHRGIQLIHTVTQKKHFICVLSTVQSVHSFWFIDTIVLVITKWNRALKGSRVLTSQKSKLVCVWVPTEEQEKDLITRCDYAWGILFNTLAVRHKSLIARAFLSERLALCTTPTKCSFAFSHFGDIFIHQASWCGSECAQMCTP